MFICCDKAPKRERNDRVCVMNELSSTFSLLTSPNDKQHQPAQQQLQQQKQQQSQQLNLKNMTTISPTHTILVNNNNNNTTSTVSSDDAMMSIQNDKSSDEQQLSAKTCNNTNGNSSNNNNNNNKIQEDDDESVHNEFGKRVLRESSAPNSIAQPAEDNVDMAATGEYSNGAGPGAKRLARNTNLNKRPRISPKSKNPNATSKLPPAPVYKPDENPTQTLNKLHPGLAFVYEIDAASLNTSTPMPPNRFICRVQIALANKIDAATASLAVESAPLAGAPRNTPTIAATTIVTAPSIVDTSNMPMMAFSGTGPSKRDAKRMCAQAVLCGLYGETYKPPRPPTPPPTAAAAAAADTKTPLTTTTSSTKEPALVDPSDAFRKRAQQIQARITKLLNNCSSRPKNASQLLNEMSAQISATAKCISQIPGPLNAPSSVVFTYNVSNINGESLVEPTGEEDSTTRVALGTGKSKKEAKMLACKHAIKQFFLFDLDEQQTAANERAVGEGVSSMKIDG